MCRVCWDSIWFTENNLGWMQRKSHTFSRFYASVPNERDSSKPFPRRLRTDKRTRAINLNDPKAGLKRDRGLNKLKTHCHAPAAERKMINHYIITCNESAGKSVTRNWPQNIITDDVTLEEAESVRRTFHGATSSWARQPARITTTSMHQKDLQSAH